MTWMVAVVVNGSMEARQTDRQTGSCAAVSRDTHSIVINISSPPETTYLLLYLLIHTHTKKTRRDTQGELSTMARCYMTKTKLYPLNIHTTWNTCWQQTLLRIKALRISLKNASKWQEVSQNGKKITIVCINIVKLRWRNAPKKLRMGLLYLQNTKKEEACQRTQIKSCKVERRTASFHRY